MVDQTILAIVNDWIDKAYTKVEPALSSSVYLLNTLTR